MRIITTSVDLRQFCEELLSRKPRFITVDTEFVRERTYWPQLCLIQVASTDAAAIIDPLAPDMDFQPLLALFQDLAITKVFHSARQDLEIFWHVFQVLPKPLFDTQIAAMVCGLGDGLGYEPLAFQLLELRIDKAQQYTNWARRPLSDKQLEYALADVQHLVTIYEKLDEKLTELARWAWLEDEHAILTTPATYQVDPRDVWKRLKPRIKATRVLATLQDIAAWREEEAQRHNVNRGKILPDEAVFQLASSPPGTIEEFREKFPKLNPSYLNAIFDVLQKSAQRPAETWPVVSHPRSPSEKEKRRLEILKQALAETAAELGVPPRLIAKKTDLEALAFEGDLTGRLMTGWRFEVFGEKAVEVLGGE